MSDLHFDADGEPVKVPADAEELRVRRFRKPGERGACEVVHGADGAPLYIPIDTTHPELRKLVDGVPGRYRLDPVDAGRRPCSGAVAMYVTIDPPRRGRASSEDQESVVAELLRANTDAMRASHETTRAVVGEFKAMAREITELVRVVTGAGLHERPTRPTEPEDDDEDDEDQEEGEEEDDAEEAPAPQNPLVTVATQLMDQTKPLIKAWVAKLSAAAMAPAPTTPAPAPADAAPATDAAPPAPAPAAPSASPVDVAAAPSAAAPVADGSSAPAAAAPSAPATVAAEVRNATPAPQPTPAQVMHLMSINEKLNPQEQELVLNVIERLDPAECARWMTELCALSSEDAVARVRSMMPPLRARKETKS